MSSPAMPTRRAGARWVPRQTIFFIALIATTVLLFDLTRAGMIWRNRAGIGSAGVGQILSTFLYGLRFDLSVACYLILPLVIVGHLPHYGLRHSPRLRKVFTWLIATAAAVITFLLLGEYEFFHEFQTRYNQLAFEYLDQPKIVLGMIWYNYPVVRYLLITALLTACFALGVRWLMRRTLPVAGENERDEPGYEGVAMALLIAAMIIAMRGGFQSEALQWGDAYHSGSEFINQMSLNGLFALGRSGLDRYGRQHASPWLRRMPIDEARALARKLVVDKDEELLDPRRRAVLRRDTDFRNSVTLLSTGHSKRPPNVVLVIMESFSARFVGACGSKPDYTPGFDKIASEGILFDHAFSGGTHTHQGVFCSMLSFPNLPGYEYLMENMVANQPFLTLPAILKAQGYQTMFLYNGNLSWDNMYGFFRKQGIDRFVGTSDYVNPVHRDRVWGVTDQDVFDRANEEFEAAGGRGPFFGVVLTLSNHAPFDLPEPLPFAHTTGMGELNKRIDGVRYADWAVGRFMERAKQLDYCANTLFVFVGDHGFGVEPKLSEANLLFHHVPLLFYSPLMSKAGTVVTDPASQLDIVPTVLALLGSSASHSSWGRNLFSADAGPADERAVVFKGSGGSGSDQAIAMVRGDKLLVVGSDMSTRLWSYRLNPDPGLTPLDDPRSALTARSMQRDLFGYVEAAANDLAIKTVTPPDSLLHDIDKPTASAR